jgi:hypothetical protein
MLKSYDDVNHSNNLGRVFTETPTRKGGSYEFSDKLFLILSGLFYSVRHPCDSLRCDNAQR